MRPAAARQSPKGPTALIIAAGELPPAPLVPAIVAGTGATIVADGGLRHAARLGLAPDLIVGDMDSVEPELLAAYAHIEVDRHSRDKDEIDLELALSAARRSGAAGARVMGAFGDRLDQGVAALLIAARLAGGPEPFRVELHGGTHSAYLTTPALPQELRLPPGTIISLLALEGDAVVSIYGTRYQLHGARLPFGTGLGVSNIAVEDTVHVNCDDGTVAVIVEHAVDGASPMGTRPDR